LPRDLLRRGLFFTAIRPIGVIRRCAILAQHRADLQAAVDIPRPPIRLVPLPTPGIYSVAAGGLNFAGASDPWRDQGCSGRFTDAAYTNHCVTQQQPKAGRRPDGPELSDDSRHAPSKP